MDPADPGHGFLAMRGPPGHVHDQLARQHAMEPFGLLLEGDVAPRREARAKGVLNVTLGGYPFQVAHGVVSLAAVNVVDLGMVVGVGQEMPGNESVDCVLFLAPVQGKGDKEIATSAQHTGLTLMIGQ